MENCFITLIDLPETKGNGYAVQLHHGMDVIAKRWGTFLAASAAVNELIAKYRLPDNTPIYVTETGHPHESTNVGEWKEVYQC